MKIFKNSTIITAFMAGLICLLIFLRALGCNFVSYDDPDYVLNNHLIRHFDLALVRAAFTTAYNGWWMPLTWISFGADYLIWQLNPFGYHLTNIVLHSLNTVLVVLIASKIMDLPLVIEKNSCLNAKQRNWLYHITILIAGLFWGVHPLRVESVAWITERKDVLNGFFTLGSLLAYVCYVNHPREQSKRFRFYLCSLMLFALSLLAKSVSVILPLMLIVIDWYPFGRIRTGYRLVLVEKIPFLLLSAIIAVVTLHFSAQAGYLVSYSAFPISQRLAVSGNALYEYCRLWLAPFGISPLYMIPDPIPTAYTIKALLFISLTVFCSMMRFRYPLMLVVWFWFVLPLMLVLALFQNGDQAFAARFTYIPSIGASIGAAVWLAMLWSSAGTTRWRSVIIGLSVLAVLLGSTVITISDIGVWQDSESFWTRVIDRHPETAAYRERGRLYTLLGNYRAAIADYTAAISSSTGVWERSVFNLYAFRGDAYRSIGMYTEADQDFTLAISIYPHPTYYYHRGLVRRQQGNTAAAEVDFVRSGGSTGPLEWLAGDGQ